MRSWPIEIASIASGAHIMGAAVLLILNPRSRIVRWFSLFLLTLAAWMILFSRAVASSVPIPWLVMRLIPASFVTFALSIWKPDLSELRLIAVMVLLVGLQYLPAIPLFTDLLYPALWVAGCLLLMRRMKLLVRSRKGSTLVAVMAIGGALIGISASFPGEVGMSMARIAASTCVLVMVFFGVVRHRLYEIEVRVAGSGALVTEAASHGRLALLGELTASVAHEVRNPLSGIRSLAQRIAEEDVSADKRRKYAEVIVGEVERLDALTGRLLALAHRRGGFDSATITDVPVSPLIDDILLLLKPKADASGVTLLARSGAESARCSREALAQILLNIILNAIAHSPRDGIVTCSSRLDSGHVELSVTDHGPGLSLELLDSLFTPFESSTGTGLGLAISRRLVEQMNGSIFAENIPEGGARFTIRLPAMSNRS